jgi:hypothetical protein
MSKNPGLIIIAKISATTSTMVRIRNDGLIGLHTGFDENTWKCYQEQVIKRAEELEKLKNSDFFKRRLDDKQLKTHPSLNFVLPHEFGGLGDPIDAKYQQINTFPASMDLPVIKPRTTMANKNEFNVII